MCIMRFQLSLVRFTTIYLRMLKRFSLFVGVLISLSTTSSKLLAQEETLLLRNPSISDTHITFVYGGDIWVADKSGANAKRLTTNPGVEINPIFSPDGKQIAFTGNYDGNNDVYTIPVYGGEPKRITFHPSSDVVRGWINNSDVYFTSTREFTYSLGSRLYKSAPGEDVALMMPEAYQGSPSPDGRYWAYIKNSDPTDRDRVAFKRYRGGGMPSIWIFDTQTKNIEIIPGERCNDVKPVWLGNKVYFLSDRDKIVNVFSYDIKSKKIEKLTNFKEYDVRSLHGRGKELTFEQAGKLHILDLDAKKVKTLKIAIAADPMHKRTKYVQLRQDIREFNISPTGQRVLFQSRGEIISVPKEKGEARNISNSVGSHEKYPSWSPNGKYISYLSDANGKYQLVLRDQKATDEPIYIDLGKDIFYFAPTWSPDSKKLFYSDAHLNLFYVDINTKKVVLVDSDNLSSATGRTGNRFSPSWSFDSEWISYVKTLNSGVTAIFMYNLNTKASHQITDGMSYVGQPTFSRDGKYLFFTASTNIGLSGSGLHMSAYERNPSFSVYAFILSKKTPTIFKNESDEEVVKEEKKEEKKQAPKVEDKKDDKKSATSKDEAPKVESKKLEVDFDNINRRIIALPLQSGYYQLDGKVENLLIYKRGGIIGAYDLQKAESKTLIENAGGFAVSADGKKMVFQIGRDFFIGTAGQKPVPNTGKVNLDNVQFEVDPSAEWKQVFNEVWSMQKEYFYVENMHGADWKAVKAKYEKFVPYVNHRSDLGYLLNEMMGELVVGHAYIYPGDQPSSPSVSTGVLGADLEFVNGVYKINKIFTTSDWNPSFKAPLAAPGLNIEEGQYIVAVDGVRLTDDTNIYKLLENKVGKQVTLKINSKPSLSGAREVVVNPISFGSEVELRQTAWIESNRKKVDELSNNQIAYVYMPNTGEEGFTNFNRYYFSQMDKKALLMDERNNGGGSVADYVIDLLSRDLIAGWGIRDGKSFTTPGNGIFGPKAMLINENAGSGGDMMPYMFRHKGLGKLVGRTTMGILVGISGYPPLLDGGKITSPNFGVFDLNGKYIIENEGVAPDIFVEQTPKELLEGRDPQLEKTVQILLDEMKTYPYKTLKKPADPNRVK